MARRNPWFAGAAGVLAWALATAIRWDHLPVSLALGDAVGPFWSAARSELLPPPHAPIYGGALVWPYRAILAGAGSLWEAFAALHAVHALAAAAGVWLAWRLGGGAIAALMVGAVVALDPGLLDTTVSGAEGYLAPLWVGLAAACARRPDRAPLAPWALGLAFANHPLSLAAAPLILPAVRTASGRGACAAVALLSLPQAWRLLGQESGGAGVDLSVPLDALRAWADQAGPAGVLVCGGPLVGLRRPRTRGLAVATLVSLTLLLLVGGGLGYLRDHHLRLLTLPAVAGWVSAPGLGVVAALALASLPPTPVQAPHQARRPGTLGLLHRVSRAAHEQPGVVVVDGLWISGTPAAEPGAVMLDLWLQGRPLDQLDVGGAVLLLVTAEREHLARLPPTELTRVWADDRAWLLQGSADAVFAWTGLVCDAPDLPTPRPGGAWDGLAALRDDRSADVTLAWQGCPDP